MNYPFGPINDLLVICIHGSKVYSKQEVHGKVDTPAAGLRSFPYKALEVW